MRSSYRFAVLSYSSQIEGLLQEFMDSDEYSLEYVPLQYKKLGMGAPELLKNGYDACLIYSSFAPSIINYVGRSIVDINKSDMDRAKALLRARELSSQIGIPIQKQERVDCEFLEYLCGVKLYKIPYGTLGELREGMLRAMKEGIGVFIGGGMVTATCQSCGAQGFPILPDRDSIADAIERAKNLTRLAREEKVKQEQLMAIFKLFKDGVLHINNKRTCTYFNLNALNMLGINNFCGVMDEASEEMRRKIKQFYDVLFIEDVLQSGIPHIDQLVSIHGRELVVNTLPVMSHASKQGVAVFLRDVNAVHDIAGKVRSIQQRQQSGFTAHYTVSQIKGVSQAMEQLRDRIRLYAPHNTPVLIHGETGTGKELVAQALHNASDRKDSPFVAINCAALPESLLESELFGYEEGAFTGARKGGKPGLFEMAHTGTIFLDEMGELSQNTQLRLLRVLENREIIRIGGNRVIPVDIRIISASHKSLPELIRNGQFRADLFYRLAVLRLEIPPLRRRLGDIPYLLEKVLEQYGRDAHCLTSGIFEAMHQYHWPGNIRELRAVIESYLIMLGNVPQDEELFLSLFSTWAKDFQDGNRGFSSLELTGDLKSMLDDIRHSIVQETVTRCAFNKKKAARQLGISYNTLWRILSGDEKSPDPTVSLADPSSVTMGIIDPAS